MFHISRAIVFIACLAAVVFVGWKVGVIALAAAVFFIPRSVTKVVHKPAVTK